MSRIFKICGDFERDDKWCEKSPAFEGKILVDDNGEFIGYCDNFCLEDWKCVRKQCFLGGYYKNGDVVFYKASNYMGNRCIAYFCPQEDFLDAEWCTIIPHGHSCHSSLSCKRMGKVEIMLTELKTSIVAEREIKIRYEKMNDGLLLSTDSSFSLRNLEVLFDFFKKDQQKSIV